MEKNPHTVIKDRRFGGREHFKPRLVMVAFSMCFISVIIIWII